MPEVCTTNTVTSARSGSAYTRVPRIEARAALQLISAAAFLSISMHVMSVTCLFLLFFFLQFFGRLGELANLQRYGLCETFESKAKSKGLRNKGSSVMSKM